MALIKSLRGFDPKIGSDCFIADNATIIGDVIIGNECSVWFNTVIRGDVNSIRIGNRVNIQDNSVLHCTYGKTVIEIGDNVSVGHNVILHGARVGNNVLIGMGAIIMDNAVIGENSVIAAGAVVLENTVIEPGSLFGGVPARFIKKTEPGKTGEMIKRIAENYPFYSKWYLPEEGYHDTDL
ncbi:MAG: gamma carbonic anhydrase family protein [Bacteroidales bacterium]|jgi:carbonic anhydrase/acetyltransferase-like protein (isoleucine patch superfamily)|nr:gamma carbonic anhydrase family protein [Bacteroidales bacterium]